MNENGRIRAVLFDLDGTLLDSRMDVFIPTYYDGLAESVKQLVDQDLLIRHLKRGTRAMMENDGSATNEQVFNDAFYPLDGFTRSELQPYFDDFYKNSYPLLREITRFIPEANEVVSLAFEAGLDVVLATNPLFPGTAIRQRMDWADISEFPFKHVTTYENSSASKPNLFYYQEILTIIGREPEECLMIGDEDWDMVAKELGIRTFLVPSSATDNNPISCSPDYEGNLQDVGCLLRSLAEK